MQPLANNLKAELSQFQDLDKVIDDNPQFSKEQIHWAIRNKRKNGMDELGVVVKFGKKIYLHVGRFATWLDMQR